MRLVLLSIIPHHPFCWAGVSREAGDTKTGGQIRGENKGQDKPPWRALPVQPLSWDGKSCWKNSNFWVFISLISYFGAWSYNLFVSLEGKKLQGSKELCPGIVRLHDTSGVQLIRITPESGKWSWPELQTNCRRAAVPWELSNCCLDGKIIETCGEEGRALQMAAGLCLRSCKM